MFGYAPVDLSDIFNRKPTEKDVEEYLNSIIEPMDTATPPLKIQITKEKKPHIIDNGLKLNPTQKNRKKSALMKLEEIISKSHKIDRDGTVDLSHNSKRTKIRKEKTVIQYIYFGCMVSIKGENFYVETATEQIKGQDPNILDLYNFAVKRGVL